MLFPFKRRPHSLPGKLIVSIATHLPRFSTLRYSLKTVLTQSIIPDEIILWVDDADMGQIPPHIRAMTSQGLSIRTVERPMRSYAKIIPALAHDPGAFILTLDDDVLYKRRWLEGIVGEYRRPDEVLCGRAHKIGLADNGQVVKYKDWRWEIEAGEPSALNFGTGVGGILYPPGVLHPTVSDVDTFTTLCPSSDDIWLYWMARMNGAKIRKVGGPFRHKYTQGSHGLTSLSTENVVGGGNDVHIQTMIERFGPMWTGADKVG